MARVIGRLKTKYGPATFYMSDDENAGVHIGQDSIKNVWTVNRVVYTGQIHMTKKLVVLPDGSTSTAWRRVASYDYIRRADSGELNVHSESYNKIREALEMAFLEFINDPTNKEVRDAAMAMKLRAETQKLQWILEDAEKQAAKAKDNLDRFVSKHAGEIASMIEEGVIPADPDEDIIL